jgi:hypothetical protein
VLLRRLAFLVLIGGLFAAVIVWAYQAIDNAKPAAPPTISPRVEVPALPGAR